MPILPPDMGLIRANVGACLSGSKGFNTASLGNLFRAFFSESDIYRKRQSSRANLTGDTTFVDEPDSAHDTYTLQQHKEATHISTTKKNLAERVRRNAHCADVSYKICKKVGMPETCIHAHLNKWLSSHTHVCDIS